MTRTIQQVESALLDICRIAFDGSAELAQIQPDTPLLESGLSLDSVVLLELVVRIEAEFNLILSEGDLTRENFFSIATLANVVYAETLIQHRI